MAQISGIHLDTILITAIFCLNIHTINFEVKILQISMLDTNK